MSLYLFVLLLALTLHCTSGQTCFRTDLLPGVENLSQIYPLEDKSSNPSPTPLYFGLMVAPSEDSDYLNTTLTAVQLALDTINADSDLLRGYSLHYTLTVSQVSILQHAIS